MARFIGLFCSFKAMTKTKVTKRAEFQARNPALIFFDKRTPKKAKNSKIEHLV